MLEKYSYINYSHPDSDIGKRIETLFLSNNQQKKYEHTCSVTKRIDIIAIQYGLENGKHT